MAKRRLVGEYPLDIGHGPLVLRVYAVSAGLVEFSVDFADARDAGYPIRGRAGLDRDGKFRWQIDTPYVESDPFVVFGMPFAVAIHDALGPRENPTRATPQHHAYVNLNTGTYSLREASSGRVVAHPTRVMLRDAELRVQPGGRARVLREKRKMVHAYVTGTFVDRQTTLDGPWRRFRYNPYQFASFVLADVPAGGVAIPVHRAAWVAMDEHGAWLQLYPADEAALAGALPPAAVAARSNPDVPDGEHRLWNGVTGGLARSPTSPRANPAAKRSARVEIILDGVRTGESAHQPLAWMELPWTDAKSTRAEIARIAAAITTAWGTGQSFVPAESARLTPRYASGAAAPTRVHPAQYRTAALRVVKITVRGYHEPLAAFEWDRARGAGWTLRP